MKLSLLYYTYGGTVTSRTDTAYSNPIECADGSALITLLDEAQWQRLVALMGNPEWRIPTILDPGQSRDQRRRFTRPHE